MENLRHGNHGKKGPVLGPEGPLLLLPHPSTAALKAAYGRAEVVEPLGRVSQPQGAIKARELAAHYTAQFQTQLHELGIEAIGPAARALRSNTDSRSSARMPMKNSFPLW